MKILYATNSGNPGGMEQHVLDLVGSMTESGHKVYVWCGEGVLPDLYRKAGAVVSVVSPIIDIDPFYIYRLAKYLSDNQVEVLHCHELKASVNGLLAGLFAGTKVKITHIHTPISEWKVSGCLKRVITKITIRLYALLVNQYSQCEVALTESRKNIKIKEGISANKLCVIPNAINLNKFILSEENRLQFRREIRETYSIKEGDFVFGNVSRMTEEKGHRVLIDAFLKLINKPDYNSVTMYLLLAGGGKLENELSEYVKSKNLAERVFITGIFEEDVLVKMYSAFDVFVFPSLAEGFGYVLCEAMVSGLPVIASDLEVLKEVGGDGVVYFRAGDPADLSDRLAEAYNTAVSGGNIALIKMNKERIMNAFTVSRFKNSYEKLYLSYL